MPRGKQRYRRVTGELFASVVKAYMASAKFQGLAPNTQASYRRFLLLAERPDTLGSVAVDQMRPAVVQAFLDGLSDTPGNQHNAKTALKSLEKWAIVRDLLPRQITLGTETVESDGGHIPWTDDQVTHAELNARPHLSRAITLQVNTGQRGSDLVTMRWTDLETIDGIPGIHVIQQKTKLKIWVPFTQALLAAMATWERRPGFILLKRDGRPFTRTQLSDQRETERARPELAPVQDLVMHGLRGTAVVRLRRAGATVPQISDMVGMSEQMVKRYCRFADQKQNAIAAVHILDRTVMERVRAKSKKSGS
jgi:integrase